MMSDWHSSTFMRLFTCCNTKDREISTGDREVNEGGNIQHEKVSVQLQSAGIIRVMRMREKGVSAAMATRLYK